MPLLDQIQPVIGHHGQNNLAIEIELALVVTKQTIQKRQWSAVAFESLGCTRLLFHQRLAVRLVFGLGHSATHFGFVYCSVAAVGALLVRVGKTEFRLWEFHGGLVRNRPSQCAVTE